jgi:CheY-like chemotaxis protein
MGAQLPAEKQRLARAEATARNVAHDLNDALTVILGNVESLIGRGGTDAETTRRCQLIREAAERGAALAMRLEDLWDGAPPASERPAAAAPAAMKRSPQTDWTILLVDDDAAVRAVTAGMLSDLGCGVVEAATGREALERLAGGGDVDLLISDLAMPEMNGAELARRARAARPDLPILFISGYADPRSLGMEIPAEQLVRKPFRSQQLMEKLRVAIERGGLARR